MRSTEDSRVVENRRPHTVYLSQSLWDMLERRHLEARLQSADAVSKIEFVEQVLQAGLDTLARPAESSRRQREPLQEKRQSQANAEPPAAAAASEPAMVATSEDTVPGQPTEAETPRAVGKKQTEPSRRRPSAMERLKQASDPGRPAPIRSVAGETAEDSSGG